MKGLTLFIINNINTSPNKRIHHLFIIKYFSTCLGTSSFIERVPPIVIGATAKPIPSLLEIMDQQQREISTNEGLDVPPIGYERLLNEKSTQRKRTPVLPSPQSEYTVTAQIHSQASRSWRPMPIPNYFSPKQRFTRSFSNDSFIQANCNHNYYFYSFFPRTIRDWNSLPSGIRTSTNFSLFKDHCFSAVRNDWWLSFIYLFYHYLSYLFVYIYIYILYFY